MKLYRVTYEGYTEDEWESEEEAIEDFKEFISGERLDMYGRSWEDHIMVEDLGEQEKE